MGCPDIYYKRALQRLSHCLAAEENDWKLASELNEEQSEEKLEQYILSRKKSMDEKLFFYDSGRAAQCVISEAEYEGCDAFNASCGGINAFEYFIGALDDEED